jgi:hypothetical protein
MLSTVFLLFASCGKKLDPNPVPIEDNAVLAFVIEHSMRIPDNRITVQFLPDGEQYRIYIDSRSMPDCPEWEYTQYHREKILSQKDYNNLQTFLEQINWEVLEKENPFGVDGEVWSMKYKTEGTVKNVELFCPYDEFKPEYRAFLDAARVLLTYSELDYNSLADYEMYEPTINTTFLKKTD